jgi:hypothetical protein
MPRDVKVRVCDDINGNSVQDIDELGIVNLRLIDNKKENFANDVCRKGYSSIIIGDDCCRIERRFPLGHGSTLLIVGTFDGPEYSRVHARSTDREEDFCRSISRSRCRKREVIQKDHSGRPILVCSNTEVLEQHQSRKDLDGPSSA